MMKTRLMLLASLLSMTSMFLNGQTLGKGVSKALAETRAQQISSVSYDLTFTIPADLKRHVTGDAIISFSLEQKSDVALDFQGGFSGAITVNGKKRVIQAKDEHIVVPMNLLKRGYNELQLSFTSLDKALNRSSDYMYTLFVPDHARSCFPCFDQPDLRARYKVRLNVPHGWKTMTSDLENPLPTYLFSFAAGNFHEKTSMRDNLRLRALYRETDEQKVSQLDDIFSEAATALSWLQSYTGIRCPFKEYGMLILPGYQFGGMEHPGAIQLSDRRIFLEKNPTQEERLSRTELIAHETAHLWFGDIVSPRWFDDVWVKEVFANFFAAKFSRRHLTKADHDLNFLRTYQRRAMATDRTDGTHPIAQQLANMNQASLLYDNIIYDKAPVVMRMLEENMGSKSLQLGLHNYLMKNYFGNATWDDLVSELDAVNPGAGVRQFSEVWVKQKGMPDIHTSWRDGKLYIQQTDPYGRGLCWRQKFQVHLVYDMNGSRTLNVDMQQPTLVFNVRERPSYIIPNYDGRGYGRFTLDKEYTARLVKRLIVTRQDLNRYALLHTLYDNYLMGRIPPSYFGELYRNMLKEKNPLIISDNIDHMFKIAFNMPPSERRTLEQCITDLLAENKSSECRQHIIRKMASNATSADVAKQIHTIWQQHRDPLFSEHDYMEMAYRLAILRPEQWKTILSTERQRIKNVDELREFDYISRACNPDAKARAELFNSLLKKENRQKETWALHALRLLNADIFEPQSNRYIGASLRSLEDIQNTSDIFFPANWMRALLAGHKSKAARQEVEQFLRQNPKFPQNLKNKVLEASWELRGGGKQ